MNIPASVFAARYKLACFYLANHLFETLVTTDPEIDLTSLSKLQTDDGFFMSSLRIVEQLTAFKSDSEIDTLQKKIEASGTMYFRKSVLTAVVQQGMKTDPNYPFGAPGTQGTGGRSGGHCDDKPPPQQLENLFDKHVVKHLYDSYFSAYVENTEPIEFLDKVDPRTDDMVSIYELGVFDTDILNTVSSILDFSTPVGALNVALALSQNPRYNTYKHFFGLVSKCV